MNSRIYPTKYNTANLLSFTPCNPQVVRQNVTGLQWMASEAWTATTVLQIPSYMPFLAGTLGIAIRRGEIPGLRDFLLRIRPDNDTLNSRDNNLVNIFISSKNAKKSVM